VKTSPASKRGIKGNNATLFTPQHGVKRKGTPRINNNSENYTETTCRESE